MTSQSLRPCSGSCRTMMIVLLPIIILTSVISIWWWNNNVRLDEHRWNGFQSSSYQWLESPFLSSSPQIVVAIQPNRRQLRLSQGNDHHRTVGTRSLGEDVIRDFVPLSCNDNLNQVTCQTWSTKFGNRQTIYNQRITIPCGECITMDYNSLSSLTNTTNSTNNKITFLGGIDIIGKLIIPESYQIHIATTTIIVQGILEISSTLTPITNQPNIRITMLSMTNTTTPNTTGNSNFIPIENNALACTTSSCDIGSKGIMVAGGSLNIRGIPSDTPTWVHIYDMAWKNDTVFLPKSIYGKWSIGAEVVITPHTSIWNATQVRTIKAISTFFAPDSNYVTVQFNEPITTPTTVRESSNFATEIALLSRNIMIDGGRDDPYEGTDHGGHLMISYTPNVVQVIEGVEFRNFGQQGKIGRYPIHFHYCNNVTGSIVSKNTIRQSNQRCIVVHGTNQLKVINNVAFDTKGHCFMTEDGIETGNEFLYNLGTQIGIPDKLIPDEGPNGNETDHEPSIYWITNPTNTFIGNVAAGSQHSGFWFEPKLRGIRTILYPKYNPMYEPLTLFKDNVAHSCNAGRLGAIRTYTPGYRPHTLALFDGLRVYRNVGTGVFIHRCHNILVVNSLVADNHIGIDIDRAEGIDVKNTTIIGESESYRILKQRQKVSPVCSRQGNLVGLDLFTWKTNISLAGANIEDVAFYDFDRGSSCKTSSSIAFDKQTLKGGLFEFYSSFKDISFHTNFFGIPLLAARNKINLCLVQAPEFNMMYISDSDGSLGPSTILSQGPSTLLASDNDQLLAFVNATNCINVTTGCYNYCQNTCFRSVRYSFEGVGQESLTLRVCKRDDRTSCTTFPGGRRGERGPHAYIAHLPVGDTYVAILLDSSGVEISSGTLKETYEASSCPETALFDIFYEGFLPVANIVGNVVLEDDQYTEYISDDDYR